MEILSNFGVEPVLLLAQIVNFAILLFILKRFLYKPIMKVLEERKSKVETSLRQAEEIEKRFDETSTKQENILDRAQGEASKIIEGAKDEAKILSEQIQKEANDRANRTIERAKQSLELEKQKMVSEAKNELVDLVAYSTEKIAPKLMKKTEKEEVIRQTIKEVGG
jgi:F-type H+-transporting ATPase subunit b